VALSGLTVDGVLSGQGAVRAEYEAAGPGGVFGARVRIDSLTPGVAAPLNLTSTRYLWLRLTLDDTLSAVGDSLATSDQSTITKVTLTTVANPPAAIAITSGAQTLTAGVCSAAVVGTLKDSGGTPTLAVSDVVVTPSAVPPTGVSFFSDAACGTPAATQTIASGAGTVTVYFKATVAGSLTLALGTQALGSGAQAQQVNAAKGTKLAFSVQPSAATVGVVITPAIKVLVQDPFGNLDPTATGTLTLGYTGGNSNLSGTTTATVFQGLATWSAVSPDIPGTFTLTADDRDGIAPLYTAATSDNFVVTAASSATKLAFTTAAQAPPVGTCSTKVTVQSQLAGGGFANQPVALPLSISAPNTAFYSDALCATPLTGPAIASGASSLDFYVIGNAVGPVTITAHSNGQALTDATQQWTIAAQTTGGDGGADAGNDGGSDGGGTQDAGPVSLKGGVNGFTCATGGAGPESLLPLLAGLVLVPVLRRRRSARALARSGVPLLLALCAALAAPARAEGPKAPLVKEATPFKPQAHLVIAVIDFTRSESFKETKESEAIDRYYLADVVRGAAIHELPRSLVMTKENNVTMLGLNGQGLEACDKLCQVETGKLLGADYVISGDLTRFGTAIKLVLKMHAVAAGNLVGSGTAEGKTLDELDKTIKSAVKELLRPLIAKAEEERLAEEEAKAQAKAEKLAEVEASAKAKVLAEAHREDLERAKRDGELQEASRSGAQAARSRIPFLGLYGGTVVDAREKSFGFEGALVLDFSPLRLDLGVAIADHLGLRAGVLFPFADSVEVGPRLLVTPLDGGTLVAGGLGLRWHYSMTSALRLQLGLAAEYYKYPQGYTNSGLGVLATAGLDLMLF
jgi:MYXO-CTERM domain-containing protein